METVQSDNVSNEFIIFDIFRRAHNIIIYIYVYRGRFVTIRTFIRARYSGV